MAVPAATASLSDLRARIDAIDEQLHRLLIERGSVVDALIKAKGTDAGRVAFRPQREAEMMRRLVKRHSGNLPLGTVEHLWREIITTFTFLQAPFRLVVDYGSERDLMHDLARFAFGFSVELVEAASAEDVVATVARTGSDLGVVPLGNGIAATPWWRGLSTPDGPRAMALWPFIAGTGLAENEPALIISPPLSEPAAPDFTLVAGRFDGTDEPEPGGAAILSVSETASHRDYLLAIPGEPDPGALAMAGLTEIAIVGGIARGISLIRSDDPLRDPVGDLS